MTRSRSDELMKLSFSVCGEVHEKCSYPSEYSLVTDFHSFTSGRGRRTQLLLGIFQLVTAGFGNGGLFGLFFTVSSWSEFYFICFCISQHKSAWPACLSLFLSILSWSVEVRSSYPHPFSLPLSLFLMTL